MHLNRRAKLRQVPQPSPQEREAASWRTLAAPVSDQELENFEETSTWNINVFDTPAEPIKVFTAVFSPGPAYEATLEELKDHFAGINKAEWPHIWEEPLGSGKIRVSFFLEGPVIGFDLTALEQAEEMIPLSWHHPAFWQQLRSPLPDSPSDQ